MNIHPNMVTFFTPPYHFIKIFSGFFFNLVYTLGAITESFIIIIQLKVYILFASIINHLIVVESASGLSAHGLY